MLRNFLVGFALAVLQPSRNPTSFWKDEVWRALRNLLRKREPFDDAVRKLLLISTNSLNQSINESINIHLKVKHRKTNVTTPTSYEWLNKSTKGLFFRCTGRKRGSDDPSRETARNVDAASIFRTPPVRKLDSDAD